MLLLAVLAAFGACAGASFHFDDYAIFSDPVLTGADGWRELWRPLQTRPLTYFTFWLNYRLGGACPAGYHLVNLAAHAAAVLLLFGVLSRLIGRHPAWIAAMLFAVHPVQAEPVAYIFARSTLLTALLALAAWRDWTLGRPWRALAWFAAALLAKEEAAAFPAFLWLAHAPLRGKPREIAAIAAMFALSLAAGLRLAWAAAAIAGSGAGAEAGIRPAEYFLAQGPVILGYFGRLVLPFGFTADRQVAIPAAPWGLASWGLLLAAAAVAVWRFHRAPEARWLLGGLVLLAPTSSLFPAADLAADRRMYLPLIAFSALAGMLLAGARPLVPAAAALLLAALAFGRTQVWMTEERLWTEAVERAPAKVRPKVQLARVAEPSLAERLLKEARRLAPEDPLVASELGRFYLEQGRPDLALGEFGRALALAPNDPRALSNRGAALLALGQTEAAVADFERALAADPCLFEALANLRRAGGPAVPPARCRYTPQQESAWR